ncbi:hypothetical protein S83_014936 [Arachis hypogaea]
MQFTLFSSRSLSLLTIYSSLFDFLVISCVPHCRHHCWRLRRVRRCSPRLAVGFVPVRVVICSSLLAFEASGFLSSRFQFSRRLLLSTSSWILALFYFVMAEFDEKFWFCNFFFFDEKLLLN